MLQIAAAKPYGVLGKVKRGWVGFAMWQWFQDTVGRRLADKKATNSDEGVVWSEALHDRSAQMRQETQQFQAIYQDAQARLARLRQGSLPPPLRLDASVSAPAGPGESSHPAATESDVAPEHR